MDAYRGSCSCGSVSMTVCLPKQLEHYRPRACDCDYCVARGARYVSDPDGAVRARTRQGWRIERQGSEQARFYCCSRCGDLAFAAYGEYPSMKCAVNVVLLDDRDQLGPFRVASPKQLPASEKLARWQQLWTPLKLS